MNFKIIDNGKKIDCNIVLTFKDEKTNIDYIVYTDGTKDEDGDLEIYASRYNIVNNDIFLEEIKEEKEWDLVDEILDKKRNGLV